MSQSLVGQSTVRSLRVLTELRPEATAVVTYTLAGPSGSPVITAAPTTYVGDGYYATSLAGTQLTVAGIYHEQWDVSLAATPSRYDGWFLVREPFADAHTRLELRQATARLLGDWTEGLVGTADGTHLTDPARTVEPDDHWRGYWCHLWSGTARGQERRVVDHDGTAGTLTLAGSWNVPSAGDAYELHGRWTVATYNGALNQAIAEVAPQALLAVRDESLVCTATQTEYPLPAGLWTVAGVWTRDQTSAQADWIELIKSKQQYRVLPGRLLRVATPAANLRLRLLGQCYPGPLEADTAICDAPSQYVVYKAAALLAAQAGLTAPGDPGVPLAAQYHGLARALIPGQGPIANAERVE